MIDGSGRRCSPGRFRESLIAWYDAHRRDLPWRGLADPYAVWVSEVLLQQSRVEVVLGRFERFMRRFPDPHRLAAADQADVLAEWSGLGYYQRARNLHAAAHVIVRDHAGVFPGDPRVARTLPGVGEYTTRAVLSIAYGLPLAVVDGNVARVLSRVSLLPVRPLRSIQEEADRLLDQGLPGDFNQALMDLGSTICLPRTPRCTACPVRGMCKARRLGRIAEFPAPRPKARASLVTVTIWIVRDRRGRLWLEHRDQAPLAGLWMFPWREGLGRRDADLGRYRGRFSHSIMNRRYECRVLELEGDPEAIPGTIGGKGRWVSQSGVGALPHSSALGKTLRVIG